MKGGVAVAKNNKGFSLVELIIVISLIAILSTTVSVTIGLIFSASAGEASSDFASLITHCRVASLSGEHQPSVVLTLNTTDNTLYGEVLYGTTQVNHEQLASRDVTVTYSVDTDNDGVADADYTISSANNEISFGFDTSGVFDFSKGRSPIVSSLNPDTSDDVITQIRFSSGGDTHTIDLNTTTGYTQLN